jgi:sugar (pentulose or hexulose) kinase
MKTVCGIDLGTQSCKLVVYDFENKNIIAQSAAPVDMIAGNDGTREQKAEWYDEALKAVLEKSTQKLNVPSPPLGFQASNTALYRWMKTERLSTM